MTTFMKYFIYIITLSRIFALQITDLTGDITSFAKMSSDTHISKNNRMSGDNIIGVSLIQYPAHILFSEFFGQVSRNSFLFSSRVGIIDYGKLSDINGNDFSAYDAIIETTIQNYKNNIQYGGSIGYAFSRIGSYTSSLLIYNIGGNKSLFDDKLIIAISLENNIRTIKNYSSYNNQYPIKKRFNLKYDLQYLPLNIIIDYLDEDISSYLTLALQAHVKDNINIYGGKKLHFLDNKFDDEYKLLDNVSIGLSFLTKKLQFNLGLQLNSASSINYGTSLLMQFK